MRDQRISIQCCVCGIEMLRSPSVVKKNRSGRFFCRKHGKGGGPPRIYKELTCEHCGAGFYRNSHRAEARFCSTDCQREWQRRSRVVGTCDTCGRDFEMKPSEAARHTGHFCSAGCMYDGQVVNSLGRSHNGRLVTKNTAGYALVYQPDHPMAYAANGRVLEHRWVAEQRLGRLLATEEQVHHMNGDKADNRPENLYVLSPSAHSAITLSERGLRRAAKEARIRELEAKLADYERRFGPL